jgi:uncharacterized protein
MIFTRKIEHNFKEWQVDKNRKPLILRGARQVGKSTLVNKWGSSYKYFVSLNLEKPNDRKFFDKEREVTEIWDQLLFEKKLPNDSENTLLFIDEIQEIPHVIKQLRYFFEDLPKLHVVVAGSLLEFALGEITSFPVGRVSEMTLHPMNFEEFLVASNENVSLEQLNNVPLNDFAFDKLLRLFNTYLIIGGMPEVVKQYVTSNFSMVGLQDIYTSIWEAYKSDIIKYAKNNIEAKVLRFIIETAPFVRDRISFSGFGGSNYKSREVGEAFRALDMAKIIYLIYPTTQTAPPQLSDMSRKPRLQFLDTGLMNYASEIQSELLLLEDLNDYYRGFVVNHGVTQELISKRNNTFFKPQFWVRENTNSNAEVDLTYKWKQLLIPIEIKSGAKGSLKSLHEFIDAAPHDFAIRFLGNKVNLEKSQTRRGKVFTLLNLPYFSVSQIDSYIEWAMNSRI